MAGEKWKIGGVTVTRIVESEMSGGLSRFLPDATREAVSEIPWLQPHFANADGRMRGSIHVLMIDTLSECIAKPSNDAAHVQQRRLASSINVSVI